ncbi:Spectrin beta chain [Schistosoma japonicum]|nr:Spectrin beta chain [Schistosoma japonicum]
MTVIDSIQLTKDDDIHGMSIVMNIQQFNRIQEYNKIELTDFEKYPLIRRYEEIFVTMTNMHEQTNITNVTLTNYYQSNEQVVYYVKIIELIDLLQRHWSKLLIEITVKHTKLIQHNQYLNVLHNSAQQSIVTDVLAGQKPFTVDKDVINSTLIQMDHLGIDSYNHNHLLVADVMTIKCYNTQNDLYSRHSTMLTEYYKCNRCDNYNELNE